ncbi:MAG TPA: hypothetical protein VMY76_13345 [Gemmatimonadales bacterium]|nr:hypothetical protein [Gemmatimonadales bacterium]
MRTSWLLPLMVLPLIGPRDPPIPAGYLGYTFCRNGIAETWLRADLVGTAQSAEVLAHEAVHRRQAGQAPGCEAFFAGLTSARRVIEVEIPAYCEELAVAVARGAERDAILRDYALRISAQSGAMENRLDVLAMLRAACPEPPDS